MTAEDGEGILMTGFADARNLREVPLFIPVSLCVVVRRQKSWSRMARARRQISRP
jgi:hypothetical protein